MHEMALCEGVLQVLEDHAASQGFEQVKTVWLEIGELSSVEIDAMRFCFNAVMRGSIADQARLQIIETPGEAWCMQCSSKVPLHQRYDACPECGGYQLQIVAGDEMKIRELEVV